jgi:hypothetical protein
MNKQIFKLSPSLHENHTDALFLADNVAGNEPIASGMLREIAHIHHTGDYSIHVGLSPQDCKIGGRFVFLLAHKHSI